MWHGISFSVLKNSEVPRIQIQNCLELNRDFYVCTDAYLDHYISLLLVGHKR